MFREGQAVASSTGNKATIDKWDCLKLNSLCIVKETINRAKRHSYRMGENISYDRGLMCRIYKLKKVTTKEQALQ
jgi:hypothetical protein